jgi:hypothetical protein
VAEEGEGEEEEGEGRGAPPSPLQWRRCTTVDGAMYFECVGGWKESVWSLPPGGVLVKD